MDPESRQWLQLSRPMLRSAKVSLLVNSVCTQGLQAYKKKIQVPTSSWHPTSWVPKAKFLPLLQSQAPIGNQGFCILQGVQSWISSFTRKEEEQAGNFAQPHAAPAPALGNAAAALRSPGHPRLRALVLPLLPLRPRHSDALTASAPALVAWEEMRWMLLARCVTGIGGAAIREREDIWMLL